MGFASFYGTQRNDPRLYDPRDEITPRRNEPRRNDLRRNNLRQNGRDEMTRDEITGEEITRSPNKNV
jgi:hypothetical protein